MDQLGRSWWITYRAPRHELDELPWRTLADVYAAAAGLLDPVLSEARHALWDPKAWTWHAT